MDTSYNKDNEKYEGMTLDPKPSTPYPPNHGQVIDSDDETETTEIFWKNNTKPIVTTIIPTSTLSGK